MEFGIFAQHERDAHAVGIHLPARRELGLQLGEVIHGVAVRALLASISHEPVIGVPGNAVTRAIRTDALDVQHVGTELIGDQERVFLVLSLRPATCRYRDQTRCDRTDSGRFQ